MPALSQVTEFGPTSSVHLFLLKDKSSSSDNTGFELFMDKILKTTTLISAQISFFSPFSWKESFTSLTKMTTEASACKSLLTPCTSLPDNRQTTKSNSSSKSTTLMVSRNTTQIIYRPPWRSWHFLEGYLESLSIFVSGKLKAKKDIGHEIMRGNNTSPA